MITALVWLTALAIIAIVASTLLLLEGMDTLGAILTGPVGWAAGLAFCVAAFLLGRRSKDGGGDAKNTVSHPGTDHSTEDAE